MLFTEIERYPPVTHPTERYIAERAQELKVFHLGLMLSIPSFFDPGLPLVFRSFLALSLVRGSRGHAGDGWFVDLGV